RCTTGMKGEFDCLDCELTGMRCLECLLVTHRWQPFHRPMRWHQGHFMQRSLIELGYILALGHGGDQCPYIHDEHGPQKMTIGDVNGMHEMYVGWCRCANASTPARQLFARCLFMASLSRPRTAFTFRMLKLFHMLNHVGRITPWDFAGTMHRLTDNVNVQGCPDIYKMFKEGQRQWRVVHAWKWAGVMDPSIPRKPGSLAIPCVSCPNPETNLDK
ncbi:hypothetical protein M422DRAFT_188553, partial [Sphaerobolus stellatus SS14]